MLNWIVFVLSPIWLFVIYRIINRLLRTPRVGYSGKYVVITGCDTGFGFLSAQQLDKLGCNVFAGCLTEKGEDELRKVCSNRLQTVKLDVSKPESIRQAYQFVKSKLPRGKGLWGLVNNAGIAGKRGRLEWFELSDYKSVAAVNLYGLIDMTMTFLQLVKIERGRIVNTSSMGGRITMTDLVPYNMTKYGVECFSDGLRRSLRQYGVEVSIIEPSRFGTNIVSPEVTAKAVNAAWDDASPEAKEEFGDEYFRLYRKCTLEDRAASAAPTTISDVTDCYEHALFSWLPKVRYVVGPLIHELMADLPIPETLIDRFLEFIVWRGVVITPAFLQKQR